MKKRIGVSFLSLFMLVCIFFIKNVYADISMKYSSDYKNFNINIDGQSMDKKEFKEWLKNNDLAKTGYNIDAQKLFCDLYGEDSLYNIENAIEKVTLFFNTKEIYLNSPIYDLYNDDVLIQLDEITKYLSGNIYYDDKTKSILFTIGEQKLSIIPNTNKITLNDEQILLKNRSKIIDEKTYIPISLLENILNYEIDWDKAHKIISIIDKNSIVVDDKSKVYKSSNNESIEDYINIEIVDNNKLEVTGKINPKMKRMLLSIVNDKGIKTDIIIKSIKGENYKIVYDLNDLKNGDYKINLYTSSIRYGTYKSYYWNIPIKCENKELFFPVSPIYKENYIHSLRNEVLKIKMLTNNDYSNSEYLNLDYLTFDEKKIITDLANKITNGAKTDYDKLLKINDWVAENIYYDWDAYYSGDYTNNRTDAIGTLESMKSVCEGYSELTEALCRAAKIPCKLVSGHALGVSADGAYWENVDHTDSNHAWNEAFVDDRWIIIDTTWNSRNEYKNSEFKKGKIRHNYFDPTMEVFSYDHKFNVDR